MGKKPTIHELEAILEEEEDSPIEILPNGEVRALGGSDALERGYRKPITMREDLGGVPHARVQIAYPVIGVTMR